MILRFLLGLSALGLVACGRVVEPPPPCTPERAVWVQYDAQGRPVMFSCDWPTRRGVAP